MQKAVISIIAAIAALMIVAGVVPYLIPSSSYQGYIGDKLSKYVNARIAAEKVHFQILPYPAFTIRGFSLVSKDGPFQNRPAITVRKLKGSLALPDLMRGKVTTSVTAAGALIDCLVADGEINLSRLVSVAMLSAGAQKKDSDIEIHSLAITDSRLNVSKDGSLVFTVDGFNLSVDNISLTDSLGGKIRMTGKVFTPLARDLSVGDLNFAGQVSLNFAGKELLFKDLRMNFLGMPVTASMALLYSTSPVSLDARISSTKLDFQTFSLITPFIAANWPAELSWQGALAADVALKGAGDIFSTAINLSGEGITAEGEIRRGETAGFDFKVSGENLNSIRLKALFPKLAIFKSFEGLSFSANVKSPLEIGGDFRAGKISLAGFELSEVDGSFSRSADGTNLDFPSVTAMLDKNPIKAGASITFGEEPVLEFEAGMENIDMSFVAAMGEAITGEGELKISGNSTGRDSLALENNMTLTGKISVPEPSWWKARPMEKLFNPDLWKILEEAAGAPLSEKAKEKFVTLGEKFSDLEISFETKDGGTWVDSVSFKHPLYELKGSAAIDPQGAVKGDGNVALTKEVSAELVPQNLKKFLLDEMGLVSLPVTFDGNIPEFGVQLNRDRLTEILNRKPKPAEPKKPTKSKKQTGPKKPAAKKDATPKAKTQPPEKPDAPVTAEGGIAPKAPEKKEGVITVPQSGDDDILRVIIGK